MLDDELEKLVVDVTSSLGEPKLPDVVNSLVEQHGVSFGDASEAVYVLWKKGLLRLSDSEPISSLGKFFGSFESLWFWILTVLVASTVLVTFFVVSPPFVYFRYVLGGVFVLFLPGSMILSVLYPRGEDMEGLERVALSIGLSLAVVPLIGLVLNHTPWGIRLTPIMISMACFTQILAIVAFVRKYRYYRLGFVQL